MTGQTVIPVNAQNEFTFQGFAGGENSVVVNELKQLCSDLRKAGMVYLWGPEGCGKTHLLYAGCTLVRKLGKQSLYVNLQDGPDSLSFTRELVDGTEFPSFALVCVDNLDCLEGNDSMQQTLFGLYEKIISSGGAMAASASRPLRELDISLKDLESRLAIGGVYRIVELDEQEKKAALQQRAVDRGFRLDDNVTDFIMTHYSRDTASLFSLLDRLDDASLRNHRRITIPFIKSLLGI